MDGQRKREYWLIYGNDDPIIVFAATPSEAVAQVNNVTRNPDTITDMTAVTDWLASMDRRERRMPLRKAIRGW